VTTDKWLDCGGEPMTMQMQEFF